MEKIIQVCLKCLGLLVIVGFILIVMASSLGSGDNGANFIENREVLETRTFSMDVKQFQGLFNQQSKDILKEKAILIKNIEIKTGEDVDVIRFNHNENLVLTGSIAQGRVKEINIIATPRSDNDVYEFLWVTEVLISTVSPELSPDERGEVLKDLGFMDKHAEMKNIDSSTIVNRVEYSIYSFEKSVIWFTARMD